MKKKLSVEYLLIFCYFLFKCFYLLPSGLLQIFDLFFISSFCLMAFKRMLIWNNQFIFRYAIFLIYVSIVNLYWTLFYPLDYSHLSSSIYYLYNLLFLWVNISLIKFNYESYRKIVLSAICSSVGLNIIFLILGVGKSVGDRLILFFNDPNQMAYFFFMLSMIYFFLNGKNVIVYILILVLVVFSASRGSIISICSFYSLLIIYFYSKSSFLRSIKYTVTSIVFILALGFIFSDKLINQYEYVNNRMEEKSDDDSVMSRGWHRLYEFPEKCILGFGEGGNYQHKYGDDILETHSTWANIILSYGIVGLGLFGLVLMSYRRSIYRYVLLAPVFLHGMIQVDSRQTTFWLVILISSDISKHGHLKRL